jgi:ElaB/YqjD/DUF883 family membrane-anchored ribosome-binding protein
MATASTQTTTKQHSSSPVTKQATDALHKTVDSLSEKAASGEEKLRETVSHSAESINHQQKVIQEKWQNSRVRGYAIENPLATAGIAFAAGVLLSSLLRKS